MTGAGFDGVDLDLLADYIGGALIGTPDDERVNALVAEDPVWREAYQRLAPGMAAVGAMLRDLPAEPMPGELADRLDALFAAPPATDPAVPQPAAEPVPVTVVDFAEAQRERAGGARSRRTLRWAAPISVAAGVLAFAGFGLTQLAGDESADRPAESAAGDAAPMIAMAPAVGEVLRSGFDYDVTTLSAGPVAASADTLAPLSKAPAVTSAETDESGGGPPGTLARLLDPGALAGCLEAIARENAAGELTVGSVDYAFYTGVPALIVRFTAANGGWAWAVGADCGTTGRDTDVLEKVPVR